VLPEFLQTTISFPSYRALVLKRATTTAGNYNINTVALKSLPIYLPPIELQEEFLVISQNIQQQKQRVSYQIRNSENLYQGLLQKAFNGELLN
jgi:type I restriction enzyme S subunit